MARSAVTAYLHRGVLAGIFLIPFIPLFIAGSLFFPYIAGKNFAFRAIVEIIGLLWFFLALLDPAYRMRKSFIAYALFVFIGIVLIADILGANPYKSFFGNYERMDGFITLAHVALYFMVVGSVFTKEKLWKIFFHLTMGVSLCIAIFGVLQLFGKIAIQQGGDRIDTTLGNAIYAALFAMFNVFLAIYYMAQEKVRVLWKFLYTLVIVGNLVVMIFAASRGVAVGFMAGLFVFLCAVTIFERERKGLRKGAVMLLFCGALATGFFITARETAFVENNRMLNRLASISLSDGSTRFSVWGTAWKGFRERPLLGWGQGNFDIVFDKHYDPRMYAQEQWFDRAHNIFFDWLVATGALGTVAYFTLFFGSLAVLWSGKKKVFSTMEKSLITGMFVAYLIQNFFVFDNITSYIFFGSMLAFIHARTTETARVFISRAWQQMERYARPIAGIACAMATLAMILFVLRPLRWNTILMQALHPRSSDTLDESIAYFRKATTVPSMVRAEAREQLMQMVVSIALKDGFPETKKIELIDLAVSGMEDQARISPGNARYPYFLGALLRRVGRSEEGLMWLENALALSPRKQQILSEIGMLHFTIGNKAEAFATYKTAYELDKSNVRALVRYVSVAIDLGALDVADALLAEHYGTIFPLDMEILAAYHQSGQYERVVGILEGLIEQDPNNAQHLLSLATAYSAMGKYDRAMEIIEQVVEKEPSFRAQANQLIKQLRHGENPMQ